MYDTKKICTYDTDEVFLDTDVITDHDKEFVRNAIYRQEMLDILGICDIRDEIDTHNEMHAIDTELDLAFVELYDIIKHNYELQECMTMMTNIYSQYCVNDALQNKCNFHIGLVLLFAYDYLHLTHICISEFIETGNVSLINIEQLREKIASTPI